MVKLTGLQINIINVIGTCSELEYPMFLREVSKFKDSTFNGICKISCYRRLHHIQKGT